ncbi:MAG TPA: sugar phosphate nucleotidyltransferase, partial [Chloroflexota bacterium]|nr:sugar phosphate nucleotidyltransferase [Chloroflexota bacterium]
MATMSDGVNGRTMNGRNGRTAAQDTAGPVRQGIILAAGRGTRIRPLSGVLPKPLQPVCNKPIMQYQLEAMREAGIREVAVVVGPGGEPIR